ncbi:MAG: PAS domain-containing protein [Syntrophobacteraceae bacterium]
MAARSQSKPAGKESVPNFSNPAAVGDGGPRAPKGFSASRHAALSALIDALPISMVTLDSEGRIAMVNKEWLRCRR